MAATPTVPHGPRLRNSAAADIHETLSSTPTRLTSRHGVITLFGYGIEVRVERGHLILKDGVGHERREGRFARVGHGLRRVVVIVADGVVSLAALQWLADQKAAFVMLERDGSVLTVTGPVSASDARIRRAQACLSHSDAVVPIVRDLMSHKITNQERVACEMLHAEEAGEQIARCAGQLAAAKTLSDVRMIESQSSAAYWSVWRKLRIDFPRSELNRVPDHWREFGSRTSPVSNRPKKAANPANAMLNYLYAILAAETRLTLAALGLDPGLGLLHMDTPTRDSLACDLMEPIRPSVDRFLLRWLARSPLKREWFFEQRDGTCRLMPELASLLGESALMWRTEIAPYVEWFAEAVRSTSTDSARLRGPRTRLTRQRWREVVRTDDPDSRSSEVPGPQSTFANRRAVISSPNQQSETCTTAVDTDAAIDGTLAARIAAQSADAIARKRETNHRQSVALQAWSPGDHPLWLTRDVYVRQVQPKLAGCTQLAIASSIGVSERYTGKIRNGTCIPHKRHWLKLAELVGMSDVGQDSVGVPDSMSS
jgi:CRISPR-associated endonuclease Cas1